MRIIKKQIEKKRMKSFLSFSFMSLVTAVTTKLQRSNALICFNEHTLKRIENEALLRYAKVWTSLNALLVRAV